MNLLQQKKVELIINSNCAFLKFFLLFLLVMMSRIFSIGQNVKQAKDYGFRHFQVVYKSDPVDILVKSAEGEEEKQKPLFLFCQGSLPIPLILYDDKGGFGTLPFKPDSLARYFHVAVISKPFIPLLADIRNLQNDYCYRDSSRNFPSDYIQRNLLSYYTARNLDVITFLQNQHWISKNKLIVAGHSEGSTIAAKMATQSKKITHLIYSGGNPFGRILTIISRNRKMESDSMQLAERTFKNWESIIQEPEKLDASHGDANKNIYEFSIPPILYLQDLKIPVLVLYGTKDEGAAPFNDYLRVELIRRKKANFTFKTYLGTEHNYFGLRPDGQPDYDKFNWDKVALDWLKWLKEN